MDRRVESLPPETAQLLETFTIIGPPSGYPLGGKIDLDESYRFFEAAKALMWSRGKSDPDLARRLLEGIEYKRDTRAISDLTTVTRTLAVVALDLLSRFDSQSLSPGVKREFVDKTIKTLKPGREIVISSYRQELRFRLGAYVTFLFDQTPDTADQGEAIMVMNELSAAAAPAGISLRYNGVWQ